MNEKSGAAEGSRKPKERRQNFGLWLRKQAHRDEPIGDLARDYVSSLNYGYDKVSIPSDMDDLVGNGIARRSLDEATLGWVKTHPPQKPRRFPRGHSKASDPDSFSYWLAKQDYRGDGVGLLAHDYVVNLEAGHTPFDDLDSFEEVLDGSYRMHYLLDALLEYRATGVENWSESPWASIC